MGLFDFIQYSRIYTLNRVCFRCHTKYIRERTYFRRNNSCRPLVINLHILFCRQTHKARNLDNSDLYIERLQRNRRVNASWDWPIYLGLRSRVYAGAIRFLHQIIGLKIRLSRCRIL